LEIRTTLVLFNPTDRGVGVELQLTDDAGAPLVLPIQGLGSNDQFAFSLRPGESRRLETDGAGSLAVGAAFVGADDEIGVSALFRLYDSAGRFITEAGVGHSSPAAHLVAIVDTTGDFNTGVALFNPGGQDAQVELRLINADGKAAGSRTLTLPRRGHTARFLAGPGEFFPELGAFRGTLWVASSQPLAAVTLRQHGATLTYTTLPVTFQGSQLLEFNLPQIANGVYEGGSIRTGLLLFNLADTRTEAEVVFRRDDGALFPLTLDGARAEAGALSLSLGPMAAQFLDTDGLGPVTVGSARVTSKGPIGAAALFTMYDAAGRYLAEAGVGDAFVHNALTVPADVEDAFDTGIALMNLESVPSTVTARLLDSEGNRLAWKEISLAGRGHSASLVSEMFPGGRLLGALSMTSSGRMAALSMRVRGRPLCYTTLPAALGSFRGVAPETPLLAVEYSGITVSETSRLDGKLAAGLRWTGSISGAVGAVTKVMASATDARFFTGSYSEIDARYEIWVPPGEYRLTICHRPSLDAFQGAPTLCYESPAPVLIEASRSLDVALPDARLQQVSGTVTGLGRQALTATLVFRRDDGKACGQTFIALDGSYRLQLPPGDYAASLSLTLLQPEAGGSQQLALYDLGHVQIEGQDLRADFPLPPLVVLLGSVAAPGLPAIPSGSIVSAVDKSADAAEESPCCPATTTSSLPVASDGAYRGSLLQGRSYRVAVRLKLPDSGRLTFPLPGLEILMSDHRQMDFALPAAPSLVTLAGAVAGPDGVPLADAAVQVVGRNLDGLPGVEFSAETASNSAGEYEVRLPPGADYRVSFSPPRAR
jgi:hypothetical protein